MRKVKALNFNPGNIDRIEFGLEKLMKKHKIYKIYADCSANFDRINEVLNSLAASRKSTYSTQRLSLSPANKKMQILQNTDFQEVNNFLLLKNILKQAYTKSRSFKLSIQQSTFRTLVASFLYLYETIDKDDLILPSHNASHLIPAN